MINYAIKTNETGSTVIQSVIESNNLKHVTDKDIVSFYLKMSNGAFVDTGLLPVDGTGLLAYRQAGNHAQIVVQRSPKVNRIIWGRSERDQQAGEYFVAQPYQIYIGDILDDNFYGARIFYSPVPITNPNDVLYHTNLPNTNCKGYRGNGVGWVCLYHTEVWKGFPIGEKMARLIERCSGAEAFNDANMNETDGTRFYQAAGKPSHLWSPTHWQKKTEEEGIDWVTDLNLWIPIKVNGIDDQSYHYDNGIPLTIGMALTGNYAAYYGDNYLPKPVNAIVRRLNENYNVMQVIKKAYVTSDTFGSTTFKAQDPYTYAVEVRGVNAKSISKINQHNEEEDDSDESDENTAICSTCETIMHIDEVCISPGGSTLCSDCFNEDYVVLEDGETYQKSDCVWIDSLDTWTHANEVTYCDCGVPYIDSITSGPKTNSVAFKHWLINISDVNIDGTVCVECCTKPDFLSIKIDEEIDPRIQKCAVSGSVFPTNPLYGFKHVVIPHFAEDGKLVNSYVAKHVYADINHWPKTIPCPCGKLSDCNDISALGGLMIVNPETPESLKDLDTQIKVNIKTVKPIKALKEQLGYSANILATNNMSYGWACPGCCVYKNDLSNPVKYEWDPQSVDLAKYSLQDLETIHLANFVNQANKQDELPF